MTVPCRRAAMLATLLLLSSGTTHAAEGYDNCTGTVASLPATITTQGVWCLKADLSTDIASGAAIRVETNNVTIECNGFRIGGLAAGAGTQAVGIHVPGRLNAVVRGCNVRGFAVGIFAQDGGGHVVEDNRVEASPRIGIEVHGAGSAVRRNIVTDTGGAPSAAWIPGIGIRVRHGADALDNTVSGVDPGTAGGEAVGIEGMTNGGGTIAGNRIGRMNPADNSYGVYDTGGSAVSRNFITGAGNSPGGGIACPGNTTTVSDNIVRGFAVGVWAGCTAVGNVVNSN